MKSAADCQSQIGCPLPIQFNLFLILAAACISFYDCSPLSLFIRSFFSLQKAFYSVCMTLWGRFCKNDSRLHTQTFLWNFHSGNVTVRFFENTYILCISWLSSFIMRQVFWFDRMHALNSVYKKSLIFEKTKELLQSRTLILKIKWKLPPIYEVCVSAMFVDHASRQCVSSFLEISSCSTVYMNYLSSN